MNDMIEDRKNKQIYWYRDKFNWNFKSIASKYFVDFDKLISFNLRFILKKNFNYKMLMLRLFEMSPLFFYLLSILRFRILSFIRVLAYI